MSQNIESRLSKIEARNARVELDKAWEISATRRILIGLLTYIFVGMYLMWLGVNQPWFNALVPVIGFALSTLVIGQAKQIWLNRHDK